MLSNITSKFGGTSGSTAEAVNRCVEIGADSRNVVVSAPGALNEQQLEQFKIPANVPPEFLRRKVTEQLIRSDVNAYSSYQETGEIPKFI